MTDKQALNSLISYGIEVLGDNFHLWYITPCKALGSLAPVMVVMHVPNGLQQVRDTLSRIVHGIFS